MEIYSESMELLTAPDLSKGYLRQGMRVIHHPAVEAVQEVWHYEEMRVYPSGGRDLRKVVDVKATKAKPAYDEEVPILIYVPMTEPLEPDGTQNRLEGIQDTADMAYINSELALAILEMEV